MIGIALTTYYSGMPANSAFQYAVYGLYAIGIVWTLITYSRSGEFTGAFGDSFNQGFRCFIVVTLIMVIFTFVFTKLHPEFSVESAKAYKEELIKKPGDKTPAEIEEAVTAYQKGYTMALVYGSIFGYLIIGAVVTAVTSLILTRRK